MENLYEYLMVNQIEEDLKFLCEDQIDEGKIKEKIKHAWNWIKGKFKKKKKNNTSSNDTYKSKSYKSDLDTNNTSDDVKCNIYNYSQISEKIRQNNNLKKGIDILDKGYNDKYKIVLAENKNEILGCLFYIIADKYNRKSEFIEFDEYDHIFSMQIDKDHYNEGISEKLLKKTLSELQKYSSFKGITLDIKEYNTKQKLYSKYFTVKKIKDSEIAVYNK